jgi:pimeloyl-ACP methyl ester carboxylesterase
MVAVAMRLRVVAASAILVAGFGIAIGFVPRWQEGIWRAVTRIVGADARASSLIEEDCWFDGDAPVSCAWLWPKRQNEARDTALPVVILHRYRLRSSRQASIYLSGGPGGSSFLFAEGIANWVEWRDRLALDHDLVLYDSRGTGYAQPELECPEYEPAVRAALAARADTAEQLARQWSAMETVLRACAGRVPVADRDANLLSTATHARDLLELARELRHERGYERVVLYGASYGSRLAVATARLAQQTPGAPIERIVLDAWYAPAVDLAARTPQSWSEVIDDYVAYCAASLEGESRARCDGKQLRSGVDAILALDPQGAPMREVELDEGMIDGSPIVPIRMDRYFTIDMLMHALSANIEVDELALRAHEAAQQRWTPAWQALAKSYAGALLDWSFSPVAFHLVECADNGESDARQALAILGAHREFNGVLEFVPAAVGYCKRLGVRPAPLIGARVEIDALVTSMRLDPITPWRVAHAALKDLPQAHWRLVEGAGHGAADSDECAARAIGAYMNSGDLSGWRACRLVDDALPQGEGLRSSLSPFTGEDAEGRWGRAKRQPITFPEE